MSAPHDGGGERLASLERRVAELERLLGPLAWLERLLRARFGRALGRPRTAAPTASASAAATPSPSATAPPVRPLPRREPLDLEQLLGGRGLLIVGVVALLTAAGLFLRIAFESGWIAPWVRVAGAVVLGVTVAVAGERQVVRGLRRFGLAMVGAGGGLAYLGLWAAAGPFGMIPRGVGVLLTAAISTAIAWRATEHDAEPLALWALLGAFLSPLVLPTAEARPETLLAYLVVIGAVAGAVSVGRGWRVAVDAALVGPLLIAAGVVSDAIHTPAGFAFVAAAGVAAVVVSRSRAWPETRIAGVLLPWFVLIAHASVTGLPEPARWGAVLAAAAILAAEFARDLTLPALRGPELPLEWSPDTIAFAATPAGFALLCRVADPAALHARPWLPAAVAAVAYLAVAARRQWAAFAAAGLALIAVALARQFDGAAVSASWSAVILLAVAMDRWMDQRGGAGVAVVLAIVASAQLFTVAVAVRPAAEPALTGDWALALYALIAAASITALVWRDRPGLPAWLRSGREALWTLAALLLFGGISLELHRFFQLRLDAWPAARLAGDLSISVWWLLYAGAGVRLGFAVRNSAVRWAGLGVAVLAAAKIAVYDLSRLNAMYRVGSVFVLALLALAIAYAYNRRARPV